MEDKGMEDKGLAHKGMLGVDLATNDCRKKNFSPCVKGSL